MTCYSAMRSLTNIAPDFSLGKGEVESSILSRSTINLMKTLDFSETTLRRRVGHSAKFGRTDHESAAEYVQNPCTHFVGFRDDRYWSAVRIFGPPDFIHIHWDRRARREIADCDTVVFATGEHDQATFPFNGGDLVEVDL